MTELLKICGVALIAAVVCIVFRSFGSEGAFGVTFACVVICGFFVIPHITYAVSYIKELSEKTDGQTVETVLKVGAVSLLGEFAGTLCEEVSGTLAKCVYFASGCTAVTIVLPLFKSLVSSALRLLP